MDGIVNRGQVVVIGATNRPEDIDVALRRPGRFDREIEIGVPDSIERLDILKIHTKDVPLSKDTDLKELADITHGFVGADLAALVKEAGIFAVKYAIKNNIKIDQLKIKKADFLQALSIIQPSGLREIFVEIPNVEFDSIGGLDDQKELINDIIKLTIQKKELVKRMGINVPKNLLLVGPPGTGKTMFVKACAKTNKINFIYIKGPEILNKWLGQSEKAIRDIFKKAREVSPVIVFFDEIDSLTINKGNFENVPKVLDQLLTELDNLMNQDIIFIAATNRPDLIDKSYLEVEELIRLLNLNYQLLKIEKK
jgi:transitional endoplasmic reticulum ATPase